MSVPRIFSTSRSAGFLPALLLLVLATVSAFAKGPEPPLRLPMGEFGFQPPGPGTLASGGSFATVNYIDDHHLLVTFSVRRLMKRLPGEPPDDQDRTIEAVVVQLPSGKVLARTEWRLHDFSSYLWNLGHGRFLLRIRDQLTTFVPLANLANDDAFVEQPFLHTDRKLGAILLSPDRDLITVETVEQAPTVVLGDGGPPPASRAQLNFYRLVQPVEPVDQLIVQSAGVAVAARLVDLPVTAAGYIEVLQESPSRWLFDFDPYVGKFAELSPYDTSCRPKPVFVSGSEFVAFGCRGSADKLEFGGFNMRGEQMWQQDFTEAHAFPNFAFAPAAGRFALSRNIVSSTAGITVDFAPSSFTTQEIRVYQTYNGKQMLRVEASPVQRPGQNYDLSPDGLQLAVIRGQAVEVYRLPVLTKGDEAAIRTAKSLEPQDARAAVNLASHRQPPAAAKAAIPIVATPPLSEGEPVAAPSAKTVQQVPVIGNAEISNGDEQPTGEPRKPPTLYTLPTDKPQDQGKPH